MARNKRNTETEGERQRNAMNANTKAKVKRRHKSSVVNFGDAESRQLAETNVICVPDSSAQKATIKNRNRNGVCVVVMCELFEECTLGTVSASNSSDSHRFPANAQSSLVPVITDTLRPCSALHCLFSANHRNNRNQPHCIRTRKSSWGYTLPVGTLAN